jgi:hypothetical protein
MNEKIKKERKTERWMDGWMDVKKKESREIVRF